MSCTILPTTEIWLAGCAVHLGLDNVSQPECAYFIPQITLQWEQEGLQRPFPPRWQLPPTPPVLRTWVLLRCLQILASPAPTQTFQVNLTKLRGCISRDSPGPVGELSHRSTVGVISRVGAGNLLRGELCTTLLTCWRCYC